MTIGTTETLRLYPTHSMYGIFTYIAPVSQLKATAVVGMGLQSHGIVWERTPPTSTHRPRPLLQGGLELSASHG